VAECKGGTASWNYEGLWTLQVISKWQISGCQTPIGSKIGNRRDKGEMARVMVAVTARAKIYWTGIGYLISGPRIRLVV